MKTNPINLLEHAVLNVAQLPRNRFGTEIRLGDNAEAADLLISKGAAPRSTVFEADELSPVPYVLELIELHVGDVRVTAVRPLRPATPAEIALLQGDKASQPAAPPRRAPVPGEILPLGRAPGGIDVAPAAEVA